MEEEIRKMKLINDIGCSYTVQIDVTQEKAAILAERKHACFYVKLVLRRMIIDQHL